MTPLVAEVLRQYDERYPGAKQARATDQWCYYSRTLLAQILAAADWALENEDVDRVVHYRVLVAMALGAPSPADAELRQQQEAAYVRQCELSAMPSATVVSADVYDRWAAEADEPGSPDERTRAAVRRLAEVVDQRPAVEMRTPEEWCDQYGLTIADPDGWRERDAPPWDQPLALPEFWRRFNQCTVRAVDREAYDRIVADVRAARAPAGDG